MARGSGPWQNRVSFAPDGSFAYRPGQLLVRDADVESARQVLVGLADQRGQIRRVAEPDTEWPGFNPKRPPVDFIEADGEFFRGDDGLFVGENIAGSFTRFNGVPEELEAIRKLNQSGIYAQPNHVLFAHTTEGVPGDGFQANPFYANPFYANPFYANPNPAAHPSFRETGRRPSSARPAKERDLPEATGEKPWVAILDTGLAGVEHLSDATLAKLGGATIGDEPDTPDIEEKGYLDPVAGHGTFIAGIIRQHAPSCKITVHKVLETYGDSDEAAVTEQLNSLADSDGRLPDLVNLSFGGYSSTGMEVLAEAIASLHLLGVTIVASAGNDGTSRPMYPAVLPHVLAVGALDHEGNPAPFTNYGPWVRACTLGVEIESTFFTFKGAHPAQAGADIDNFDGWAVWSGTSFATPIVVAALARKMATGGTSRDAVEALIDLPGLERRQQLGVVIQ